MLIFEKWVREHVKSIDPKEWFDGDISTWFLVSDKTYAPEDLFDEFEAEVEEILDVCAEKMEAKDFLSYTKDMYGILTFSSNEDRKIKCFELAVFLCASKQHKEKI